MLGRLIRELQAEDQISSEEKKKKPILKLMTVQDAAEVLNCSHNQVYRYLAAGFFDSCLVKLGSLRTVRFHPGKFIELIERGGFKPSINQD